MKVSCGFISRGVNITRAWILLERKNFFYKISEQTGNIHVVLYFKGYNSLSGNLKNKEKDNI